jgi:hypothetical protein
MAQSQENARYYNNPIAPVANTLQQVMLAIP